MKGRYDFQPSDSPAPASPPRRLVLAVDDEPRNLKVLHGYLSVDGYDVECVESGEAALERLARGGIDLVVLDVRMPGMDGIETCRRIRQNTQNSRLPIIFLTADAADEEREYRGLDVGGDEYLHKPISRRVLSARVRNLLRLADVERERTLLTHIAHAEKLAAIGQVAAGVAHEINNPLSFILSNLDSLRGYFADLRTVVEAWRQSPALGQAAETQLGIAGILADVAPLLDETVQGGTRVRSIIQEFKTFSRHDDDKFETIDLADIVRSTLLLTERELGAKATLVRELESAFFRAPRQKLHQLTLNLLVNAMHAVEAKPLDLGKHVIRVATRTEGDCVVLEISDTGCGIPEDIQRRIFEPFFTTKPVGVGTGLGLSVCAMVVQRLGGSIEVNSTLGEGTTFAVRMPCEPEPEAPEPLKGAVGKRAP